MGVKTILLAVGKGDERNVDNFVGPTVDIATPTGATVVIGHVFDEDTYERTIDTIEGASSLDDAYTGFTGGDAFSAMSSGFGVVATQRYRDGPSEFEDTAGADVVARRYDTIRQIANELEDADVSYEVHGAVGDPAEGILEMITDTDADFVVVGGRQRSKATETLFGSVSREIIRLAPCPVISVRHGGE